IESSDYRAYVANLRGIGCPERTIRDLIVADVHDLYVSRREALEPKASALQSASGDAARLLARQSLDAECQRLREEETAVIAVLLGSPSDDGNAEIHIASRVLRNRAADQIVSMPLVFQNVGVVTM